LVEKAGLFVPFRGFMIKLEEDEDEDEEGRDEVEVNAKDEELDDIALLAAKEPDVGLLSKVLSSAWLPHTYSSVDHEADDDDDEATEECRRGVILGSDGSAEEETEFFMAIGPLIEL